MTVAAQSVTTPVVGGLTLNLEVGSNHVGFALQPVLELQTTVSIAPADRTRIVLPETVTVNNQQYGGPGVLSHVAEFIDSGPGEGFHANITQTTGVTRQLTLQNAVPAGVNDGARVRIWRLWTLAGVFGAANDKGLTGGTQPTAADVILLPQGSGFAQYFYSTGGAQGTGWRLVGGGTANQAGVTIPFAGGLIIHAVTAKPVVFVGQVKPGKTRFRLQTGRNFLANVCPVNAGGPVPSSAGLTLANSGLAASLQGGRVSALADLVMIWNGVGYSQFYYSTGGLTGVGWRRVGGGTADQGAVPLPDGAFVIQRRGAALEVTLNQGAF
jgi:uncharacterized protein (TIGR02597 family)